MEPNNERKTPAGEQNELFKKQVFTDETLRTADPDEEETGEQHFETLIFDKPAVLDERFAARKAERETAQPPQAKPAAPRPAAKPVKRQVPAAQKNKSVSHERRLYSGETPSDAALRITRQIAALVLCLLLVCGGFWAKGTVWDIWTDRDIEDVQKSTYYSAAANSAQLSLDQNLPIGYVFLWDSPFRLPLSPQKQMTKTRSSSPQTLRAAWKRRSAAKSCSLKPALRTPIFSKKSTKA